MLGSKKFWVYAQASLWRNVPDTFQTPSRFYMGSFPHPMQYFAAAGENDDFVIAVINFQLNQYF